jgi:SNF2 family DNA or RNA helicase
MKEDVLSDLPPKITQDYVCDLSPLQIQLYEDFARSRVSISRRSGHFPSLVRVSVESEYLLFVVSSVGDP